MPTTFKNGFDTKNREQIMQVVGKMFREPTEAEKSTVVVNDEGVPIISTTDKAAIHVAKIVVPEAEEIKPEQRAVKSEPKEKAKHIVEKDKHAAKKKGK